MKQKVRFGRAQSDIVIGELRLKDNYMASICKNYHREIGHQGSPKQLVQNVLNIVIVVFQLNSPEYFSTEVSQEICLMVAFSFCVLCNVLHTLHTSLLAISLFCKAKWKFSDVKFSIYIHILNYFRVWLPYCWETVIADKAKDNFECSLFLKIKTPQISQPCF